MHTDKLRALLCAALFLCLGAAAEAESSVGELYSMRQIRCQSSSIDFTASYPVFSDAPLVNRRIASKVNLALRAFGLDVDIENFSEAKLALSVQERWQQSYFKTPLKYRVECRLVSRTARFITVALECTDLSPLSDGGNGWVTTGIFITYSIKDKKFIGRLADIPGRTAVTTQNLVSFIRQNRQQLFPLSPYSFSVDRESLRRTLIDEHYDMFTYDGEQLVLFHDFGDAKPNIIASYPLASYIVLDSDDSSTSGGFAMDER